MTSACLTERETRARDKRVYGPNGTRAAVFWFHNHGFGNVGATSGHLIPDYARVLREGWKAIYAELEEALEALSPAERRGKKGGQLRAMLTPPACRATWRWNTAAHAPISSDGTRACSPSEMLTWLPV
jgi:formate C-acetyltransferase